jgi:patatin-like phospholipase/acyl hydrolase
MIVDVAEIKHMPRILALDGGGVRGLSSLLILQRLMQEVQHLNGDSEPPLPCEYFDLICGTSTGGLIAIMLGRLRMVRGSPKFIYLELIGEVRGQMY